jgi:hypothetical protein
MVSKLFAAISSRPNKEKENLGIFDIAAGLFLLGGVDILYLFLPRGVVVVIWLLVAFLLVKRRLWSAMKKHKHLVSAGRAARRLKTILKMSDDEFEDKFGATEEPQTAHTQSAQQEETPDTAEAATQKVAPFMPPYACTQTMTQEKAMQLATAWWEDPGTDGLTGMQRIEELIQKINMERSTVRTAILTEYADSLCLPKEKEVLTQLIEVAKSNGLGAEMNEDGDVIILWGQDDSGREAGS